MYKKGGLEILDESWCHIPQVKFLLLGTSVLMLKNVIELHFFLHYFCLKSTDNVNLIQKLLSQQHYRITAHGK